ncbi:hypothetical protein [Capnocytophaga gingivalis]
MENDFIWKGSQNELYELFKSLKLSDTIETMPNTDIELFNSIKTVVGIKIKRPAQMKQKHSYKDSSIVEDLRKNATSKELKEILKNCRKEFKDYMK